MAGTTTRALSLLNLLQTHRSWTGPELAARLGVSERTLRRDVERLRELGYRIESAPGADGGYRLEAGSAVPPLLLTDEEAVTMAVGLRLAAIQRLAGGPETSLSALAKLEQVLPTRLRRKVAAMAAFQPVGPDGPLVAPELLGELALACRDHERVRFTYVAADGAESHRHVEPHTVVPAERAWYLLAWDVHRGDWRTFRVDRMTELRRTAGHFTPRSLDEDEVSHFVWSAASSYAAPAVVARAVLDLPIEAVREHFGPWSRGAEPAGESRTAWPIGGKDARELPFALVWIPEGVSYVLEAEESVRAELHEIARRLLEATAPGASPRSGGAS